ncbi:hypothetical protein BGZ81_003003 [Podila clonocystis]|nr:hypothetical protein BGZ81_003003 [Podila clonocystis]
MTIPATQHQDDIPHNPQSKVPASAWQKTFAISELRTHIATFLDAKDIVSLIQTCRHWHQTWLIELFTAVVLHSLPSPHVLAMLGIYGHRVRTLELKFPDCGAHCAQILQLTPNTRSLDLYHACLSESQMEEIVFAAPASLRNLQFFLEQAGAVVRDELFVRLAHLGHLRSVSWGSVDIVSARAIHVDDILLVLEACPQLTDLFLGDVEIIDVDPALNASDASGVGSVATFHIADLNTNPLYVVGCGLHILELYDCIVSDESLLRLLGIRSADPGSSAAYHAHPLTRLELNLMSGNTVTSRSIARILQDCRSLEALSLSNTNVVLSHIFRESQVWPCAQSLREVCFENKRRGIQGQMTSRDQELLRDRLRSLSKLEYLCIVGYPLGFAAVEDLEFAQSLRRADLALEVEAPWDYFQEDADAQLLAQGNWWIKSQMPRQWGCSIKRGPPVQYYLGYDRNQIPKSDIAALL